MKALTRMIRSLFGLSKSSSDGESDPNEGGVTVEREAVDAETEAAVKGTGETDEAPVATAEEAETSDEPEVEPTEEDDDETEAEPAEEEDAEPEAEPAEEDDDETEATEEEAEPETETAEDEAEEPESEPETEATAGEAVSVEEINGIGPTYSERLAEAGLGTVAALAESDPATIAEAAQAPESRAEEWIDQAAGWD